MNCDFLQWKFSTFSNGKIRHINFLYLPSLDISCLQSTNCRSSHIFFISSLVVSVFRLLVFSCRWGDSTFHCKWGWTKRLRAKALRWAKSPLAPYERDIENIVIVAAAEILKILSSWRPRNIENIVKWDVALRDVRCFIKGWGLGDDGWSNNGNLAVADGQIVILCVMPLRHLPTEWPRAIPHQSCALWCVLEAPFAIRRGWPGVTY